MNEIKSIVQMNKNNKYKVINTLSSFFREPI